ncbi:MAG: nitroreductase family protein [Armatimonadetes bacterium]|nr:nitroreductase family protein [Armatimonadota bacterium]
MDLFDAIRGRRSIRKFKPDSVLEEDMRRMIEAATLAPSAGNKQMWKFVAVLNKQVLKRMADAVRKKLDEFASLPEGNSYKDQLEAAKKWSAFFEEAPVTIVVLGERYRSTIDEIMEKRGASLLEIDELRQRPDIQSIGAAIQNLCLAAYAMGYGTCWMSAPCVAGSEIKEILGIRPPWEVIALVPVGIADELPAMRPRKPLEEVLEFIR